MGIENDPAAVEPEWSFLKEVNMEWLKQKSACLQVSSPNPRPTPQKKLDIELPYDLAVLP
jgi:hypothetical protein